MQDPGTHHYLRSITKSGSPPPVLVKDSVKAVLDEDKAELFNKYFYSVFTDSTMLLPNFEEVPFHLKPSMKFLSVLKIYIMN